MDLIWEKEKTGTGNKHSVSWKIFRKDAKTLVIDGEMGWVCEAFLNTNGEVEYERIVPIPKYIRAKVKSLLKQLNNGTQEENIAVKPTKGITVTKVRKVYTHPNKTETAEETFAALGYTQTIHTFEKDSLANAVLFTKRENESEMERIGMIRTKVVEFYLTTKEVLLYETTLFRNGKKSNSDSFVMDAALAKAVHTQLIELGW